MRELNTNVFLSLVRLGIGNTSESIPEIIDWSTIKTLADEHGLSAVLLDGIELLPEEKRPPKAELLALIGEILQKYEQRFNAYRNTIAEMARWYNRRGFKMMVLKGYACAINWPKPEHRPCGDIDIW